jgi:hypothetical protein
MVLSFILVFFNSNRIKIYYNINLKLFIGKGHETKIMKNNTNARAKVNFLLTE